MYRCVVFLTILSLTWGEDYYELLGINRMADEREIRKAFKKLAVTQHPDKNNDDPKAHEKFVRLTTAYEVLKDRELRKKYDLYGEEGLDTSNKKTSYHSWNYYQHSFGIYDDDPEIITLTRNDYFESVINSDRMWLVNFYSPRCSHCHTLAPDWRKVAKELEGVIRVGAVNCGDDWQLCNQVAIQSYPTLLYYAKNSRNGVHYGGEKTYKAIIRFVLDRLDANIREINESVFNLLLQGHQIVDKPTLVFTCGEKHSCFSSDERVKTAATFDRMIDTQICFCKENKCNDTLSSTTSAVYFAGNSTTFVMPILFNDVHDASVLIERILDQLPEPQDLSADDFEDIRLNLKRKSAPGWLVCFNVGHATDLNLLLKRIPSIIHSIKLGKINCGKYSRLCNSLNINRYPMWGVLKPGGAFEVSHGKNTINDISKFVEDSIRATNVWALTAEKILSILQRENGNEAWFLDWYAPWCPPCIQFLPEVRKASLEFDASVVRFGTIDCTVHASICHQYNIRSYPTGMLINGTNTHQFTLQKTAANIIQFIEETRNPTVIQITSKTFNLLAKKKSDVMWVVDYFAPWCRPCQQLASEWTVVAKTLNILPNVNIANVNCETESSLCRSQGIRSYPTIRMYPIGTEGLSTIALYNGARDSLSMLRWIVDFFPKKVHDLNAASLQKEVLSSKNVWVVDYYAPWCSHCQNLEPQLAIAAQLLEKKVRFGRINCDIYVSQCNQAGVKAYPTLVLYNQKRKNISDGVRIETSTAERMTREISNHLNSSRKHNRDEL